MKLKDIIKRILLNRIMPAGCWICRDLFLPEGIAVKITIFVAQDYKFRTFIVMFAVCKITEKHTALLEILIEKFENMKRITVISFAVLAVVSAPAQNFEECFEDSTLRLDYIFAGTNRTQDVFLDQLCAFPGWAGRRHHLNALPLNGNGQITVCDEASGDTLYRHSFSTLFQEWQSTEEAVKARKSFENTFLVPYPKRPVRIAVTLTDTHHRVCAEMTHRVDPKDILIRRPDTVNTPFRYIRRQDDPSRCIDVVFVAEGYTETEAEKFYDDCAIATEAILSHEPFASLKDRFNFIAVAAPSEESGVSSPGKGVWKNTAVDSHFDTFYSKRYLTTLHLKQLHDLLSGIPYEHIVILANTDQYGGGGIYNSYTLTAAHHASFRPVVVHEFGHSFGGLADEYYYDDQYETMYPSDTEPWEQNITTLKDFSCKWKDMLADGTQVPTAPSGREEDLYTKIGVYEGAGYQSKGVYRPCQECRMKINAAPVFCPVCRRAMERLIRFYTEE